MPKDKRIFVTLAVDMDRNPKLSDLNDAQKWLIVKAIMHCREFLTDGVIKLSDWNKMGTNRNRIAVESCGVVDVDKQQSVAILHDYSEHNQTREEVTLATEAKKAAGSKGGKVRAANAEQAHRGATEVSKPQAAAWNPLKQTLKQNQAEEEEEKEKEKERSNSPTKASRVSNASASEAPRISPVDDGSNTPPRGPAPSMDGWAAMRAVIPSAHPQATKTALALECSQMLRGGTDPDDLQAALQLWLDKPNLGPKTLPSLVSEVIRNRTRPAVTDTRPSTTDARVAAAQALKRPEWDTPPSIFANPRMELEA